VPGTGKLEQLVAGGGVEVVDVKLDPQAVAQAYTRAVAVAASAPSIHNSQPWRWRLRAGVCELLAQRDRQLGVTDPDGRLLLLSCGAALHHARLALAAEGWRFDVDRQPEPDDADLLARIRLHGQSVPNAAAVRLSHAVHLRHTDRRPVTAARAGDAALAAIGTAAEAEGAWLHLLRWDQVVELAAAACYAQQTERAETEWISELAYWTGGTRPTGAGIPDTAIPAQPTQTTVPCRDFGHPGILPVSSDHDRAATFALLYGDEDNPRAWLPAGEALSAAWLTACQLNVSVVPLSAPIEVTPTREALRRLLAGAGYPYLVLRLGIADTDLPSPEPTPRLPASEILETE
jgi:nitroreductase